MRAQKIGVTVDGFGFVDRLQDALRSRADGVRVAGEGEGGRRQQRVGFLLGVGDEHAVAAGARVVDERGQDLPADAADEARAQHAVGADHERGGKGAHVERAGELFPIVDRLRIRQAFRCDERAHDRCRFGRVDAQECHFAASSELFRRGDQVGRFLAAGRAPGRPRIDHQRLAAKVVQGQRLAGERGQREIRRRRTDLRTGQGQRAGDDKRLQHDVHQTVAPALATRRVPTEASTRTSIGPEA